MPEAIDTRIPVYLLSGFLGSGKTTLLSAWLRQAGLRDAAVIVNELGEVGLDNALLGAASESAALIPNACVCCTGLPGLEEALEDLFWARLHRRMPAFPCVAIETTGLADPAPVIASFERNPLLRERYRLAGVMITIGAATGQGILAEHAEARAQAECADVLVMTKIDMATGEQTRALAQTLRAWNMHADMMESSHGGLEFQAVLDSLDSRHASAHSHDRLPAHLHEPRRDTHGSHTEESPSARAARSHAPAQNESAAHHGDAHGHDHDHGGHHHTAQSYFVPLPQPIERHRLLTRLHAFAGALSTDLLRLKGVVELADGTRAVVQFAPGESRFDIRPQDAASALQTTRTVVSGLTVIARGNAVESLLARLADDNRARPD